MIKTRPRFLNNKKLWVNHADWYIESCSLLRKRDESPLQTAGQGKEDGSLFEKVPFAKMFQPFFP